MTSLNMSQNHIGFSNANGFLPIESVLRKFKTTGKGLDAWKELLNEQFPGENSAIDEYFKLLKGVGFPAENSAAYGLKLVPLWVAWLLINTGIIQLVTPFFSKKMRTKSTLQLINELTENQDLR